MPKQIKIGFDKTPSPPIKIYPTLVDIQGTPLTDSAGNPLVTEEGATLASFARANNSTSAFVTNKTPLEAIPVKERFSEESEVSTTLLGVKRAEEQLSLFSDVSTYGLDRQNWNYYSVGANKAPGAWYTRAHPVFGERSPAKFYEATDEQALYLRSFPTQFGFPSGPRNKEDDLTNNFKKYLRWIALGRWLYEVWKDVDLQFANANFLPNIVTIVDNDRNPIEINSGSWLRLPPPAAGFQNEIDFFNVQYKGEDSVGETSREIEQNAMDQIELWTIFYTKMRSGVATYPTYTTQVLVGGVPTTQNETFVDSTFKAGPYQYIQAYTSNDYTRPGGTGENGTIGVLESRKTFRYQPGRVSGFTFGLRLKNNPASATDKIEWGAANTTDQYMFQVSGSQFNIVRRSTVVLPRDLVEDPDGMNLIPMEQYQPLVKEVPPSQDASEEMYTLTIPRSKWNGDPLDGTGESGYIINFETVTMYKIEYSWYGAVGAKFYAYVPIGGGDARWVRLHTLVIENGLPQPILQNPDFKFRYVLSNKNTEDLAQPTYVYKYGSSYYIDGGDEGTITLNSITSDTREFSTDGSIIGMHPKTKILNSTGLDDNNIQYGGADNLKKIYPATLAAFTDSTCRIDIEYVKTSPDGHHGCFSVDLVAGNSFEKDITFQYIGDDRLDLIGSTFDELDDLSKIVGDGVYNQYVSLIETGGTIDTGRADIRRRSNYNLSAIPINEKVRVGENYIDTENGTFTARLIGYKSVVASNTPIYANRFKVHFLMPAARMGSSPRHFADFAIGFTPDEPIEYEETLEDDTTLRYLQFGEDLRVYTDGGQYTSGDPCFKVKDQVHVEFSHNTHEVDLLESADYEEEDTTEGIKLELDYRIRGAELPFNGTRGVLGCVQGEVNVIDYSVFAVVDNETDPFQIPTSVINAGNAITPGEVTHKIVFGGGAVPPVNVRNLGIAEIGINRESTDYVYISTINTENYQGQNRPVAYVKKRTPLGDGETSILNSVPTTYPKIQARTINLFDDNKLPQDTSKNFSSGTEVIQFNCFPLYMFVAMKSDARINNIIVEEFSATSSGTHTPNFLGTKQGLLGTDSNIDLFNNGALGADPLTATGTSPTNFVDFDRLSGVNYDTSTQNPIAPGEKIYSFFVGSNEAVSFDLSNLFDIDRGYLSTGLYNNNALYFKAVSLVENQGANVQMTITSKEQ